MQQESVMADFIDQSWIKTSDYQPNFFPAGSVAINQASENGDCTVKGFYDPKTGEYHIQEVAHNTCNKRTHPLDVNNGNVAKI
jgi:hypothetical protein